MSFGTNPYKGSETESSEVHSIEVPTLLRWFITQQHYKLEAIIVSSIDHIRSFTG